MGKVPGFFCVFPADWLTYTQQLSHTDIFFLYYYRSLMLLFSGKKSNQKCPKLRAGFRRLDERLHVEQYAINREKMCEG